ncbi:hypothetical protein CSW62_13900 [Caulobacter sp. FWC2]|nr:hypothetical protein CSW62_13900 [Caulobacter sp. FWC2]
MGASSFYFYPPLAFYFGAVVAFFTGGALTPEQVTAWACLAMSFTGSVGMYAWLRPQAGWRPALFSSVIYSLAPYYLFDIFARGALGEVAVHAVLPLFALSLQRASERLAWVPLLALSFAGLILGHVAAMVPIALIAAPVVSLYLIFRAVPGSRTASAARLAAGALLGLGLSATYLAPALALQSASSMKFMWGPPLSAADPASWTLLNSKYWPSQPLASSMAWLGWTYGAVALGVLLIVGRASGPRAAMARVWALVSLVAIATYAFPGVWHGPLAPIIGKMQFPFRMLVMVEFALISALCLALAQGRWRVAALASLTCVALYMPVKVAVGSSFVRAERYPLDVDVVIAERIRRARLPEEHLPADFFFDPKIVVSRVYLDGFERLPLAAPGDTRARVIAASQYPDGSVALRIKTPIATPVVVRRFFFVSWRADIVRPGNDLKVNTSATGPSRLLTFEAQPGEHVYRIHIVRESVEKLGDAIALISLAMVALLSLVVRNRGLARPSE